MLWTPPVESGAGLQPKSNFVNFSLKILHLVATVSISTPKKLRGTQHSGSSLLQRVGGTCPPVQRWIYAHGSEICLSCLKLAKCLLVDHACVSRMEVVAPTFSSGPCGDYSVDDNWATYLSKYVRCREQIFEETPLQTLTSTLITCRV